MCESELPEREGAVQVTKCRDETKVEEKQAGIIILLEQMCIGIQTLKIRSSGDGDITTSKIGSVIQYCRCNKLECGATVLSVVGGFFNPLLDPTLRLIGFLMWFAGNVLWLHFSYTHKKWGMWTMQFFFSIQNMLGIGNMLATMF